MLDRQFYLLFGARLADLRRSAGLTQVQLADRVGINRGALANIETGRQRVLLHQLLDFASALGVPSAQLLPMDAAVQMAPAPQFVRVNVSGRELTPEQSAQVSSLYENLR